MRLLLLALLAAGCTFERGDWFAALSPSFGAAFVARADRDAGDRWQKLANDYQVRLQNASMTLDPISLDEPPSSGGFDPENPPAGVGPCHGGHCHTADGRLVPYEELAAAEGGAPRAVVRLPVGAPVDLIAGGERMLTCDPRCDLPFARITAARAPVRTLLIAGVARDGRSPPRIAGEVPFRFELRSDRPLATLSAPMQLRADGSEAPRVALRLSLELTVALLDGIDLGDATFAAARERLLENLTMATLVAHMSRTD